MRAPDREGTLGFAAALCAVCGLLVSTAATALRPRQEANAVAEVRRNVLVAVGLLERSERPGRAAVDARYRAGIDEHLVDRAGRTVAGRTLAGWDRDAEPDLAPVFVRRQDGRPVAYCVPVSGPGLWSTIRGLVALEPDLDTVRAVVFYEHGETPGLGSQVEEGWFQAGFVGKRVHDASGALATPVVARGRAQARGARAAHTVDGISGATLTGRGVTELLRAGLERYEPFFQRARREGGP